MVLSWAGTARGKIGAGAYAASGVSATVTGGADLTVEFNTGTLSLVQFEVGSAATPFEHRANELALCQRYYCKSFPQGTAPAQNTATGSILRSLANDSGRFEIPFFTPVTMRAAPSVTLFNPFAANGNVFNADNGTDTPGSATITDSHVIVRTGVLNATDANDTMVVHLTCDAEL